MRIVITKSDLQRELEFVKPATVGAIEAFKTVRLDASDGRITLKAHNGNIALRTATTASVTEAGSVDIRCAVLLDIVKSLGKSDLVLYDDHGSLVIEQGDYVCRLQYAMDYIAPEDPTTDFTTTIAGEVLRGLLDASMHAVADADHPHLSACALLEFRPNRTRAVATDGHRLSMGTIHTEADVTRDLYIHKSSLDALRAFVEDTKTVTIKAGDRQIVLEDGDRRLVTGLSNATVKFPAYEKLLALQKHDDSFVVDRDGLEVAIRRTMILSIRSHRQVALHADGDKLRVVVDSAEEGSTAGEWVTLHRDNPTPVRIRVNSVYLLDAVQAAQPGDLLFKFGNDRVPMLITPSEPASIETTSLVMPLQDKK